MTFSNSKYSRQRSAASNSSNARQSSGDSGSRGDISILGPVVMPIVEDMLNPSDDDYEPKFSVLANTRLTSLLGLIIFVELLLIGITVPAIGQLFALHAIIGYLLIVPILLKIASTSYRFFKYYLGNEPYKAAGPPRILLRVAAPILVISTIILMASGVVLMIIGPTGTAEPLWKTIHQASFVVWFAVATVHIVSYFSKAFYQGGAEIGGKKQLGPFKVSQRKPPFRLLRLTLVALTLILSVVVLILQYHYIAPWQHYFSG